MRIILFSSADEQLYLGEAGVRGCNLCRKPHGFQFILAYTYFHLWYLFGIVTKREYLLICNGCNNTTAIAKPDATAQFSTAQIPFMRRFGLMGLAVVILIPVALARIGGIKR